MPKYSTGGTVASGSGTACELCGSDSSSLSEASVAGAQLMVCESCSDLDESKTSGDDESSRSGSDRSREVVEKSTDSNASMWDGDTTRWEDNGAGYEDDQLPYLVSGSGEIVKEARMDADMTVDELARKLGVNEMVILAVERGKTAQEGVNGSVISGLEAELDVELVDAE